MTPAAGVPPHQTKQEAYIMTERMIENRVNKLRELEAQQKELEAQAEAIPGRAQGRSGAEGRGRAANPQLHPTLEGDHQQPPGRQGPESGAPRCVRPVLQGQHQPPLYDRMRKARYP